MYSNHPPMVSAADEAVWRRAVTVRFYFNFRTYSGFDRKVKDKLRAPEARPGILAWLVRGALAWKENGLMVPDVVKVETAAHRLEVSEVQTFITESCDVDATVEEHAWGHKPGVPPSLHPVGAGARDQEDDGGRVQQRDDAAGL